MPLVQVEPDIRLEHNGVTVFETYPDGFIDGPSYYWFTTDPKTSDGSWEHGRNGHFDARILTGLWPGTPTVGVWDDWWKPRFRTEDEAIDMLIRKAIDEGRLPHSDPRAQDRIDATLLSGADRTLT